MKSKRQLCLGFKEKGKADKKIDNLARTQNNVCDSEIERLESLE